MESAMSNNKESLKDARPATMPEVFQATVARAPRVIALRWKEGGQWMDKTYSQYYNECVTVAKAFIKLGLKSACGVSILGRHRPEWVIAYQAALFAGGFVIGLRTQYTLGEHAPNISGLLEWYCSVLNSSKSNIVVVESQEQLELMLEVRKQYNMPNLKAIVHYRGEPSGSSELSDVFSWQQIMELGQQVDDIVFEERLATVSPEDCAAILYTSGSTGPSKGVMLSHDNLTWSAKVMHATLSDFGFDCEHFFCYSTLSHIGSQNTVIHLPTYCGGTVNFADPAEHEMYDTLRELQPTDFVCSPKGWEYFKEYAESMFQQQSAVWRWLVDWARKKAFTGYQNIQNGLPVPWGWTFATQCILNKVTESLGLSKAKYIISGGNFIDVTIIEFFMSIGVPIIETYGLSETSGAGTTNVYDQWRLESVGKPYIGTEIKIHRPNEIGEGEVCVRGRCVFIGYLGNEELSSEVIDQDGWFHSGDIGKIDKDGYLFIMGRVSDQIALSSGCAVAPHRIEMRIRRELPFLSNVVVVGENQKFLSCLITLKCATDPSSGLPLDELHAKTRQILSQELGCHVSTVSEILKQKESRNVVFTAIQKGVDRANTNSNQKVEKFAVLPTDFSIVGGEYGHYLKYRREYILTKYAEFIEQLYRS